MKQHNCFAGATCRLQLTQNKFPGLLGQVQVIKRAREKERDLLASKSRERRRFSALLERTGATGKPPVFVPPVFHPKTTLVETKGGPQFAGSGQIIIVIIATIPATRLHLGYPFKEILQKKRVHSVRLSSSVLSGSTKSK